MMYCQACEREFAPEEHETGDCPQCSESMWTSIGAYLSQQLAALTLRVEALEQSELAQVPLALSSSQNVAYLTKEQLERAIRILDGAESDSLEEREVEGLQRGDTYHVQPPDCSCVADFLKAHGGALKPGDMIPCEHMAVRG